MRILGLIPARGGSKGIPRKNLALLAGKSLLAWTAQAALCAKSLEHVMLSTDDEEIAEAGRRLGLDVPFLRPGSLAKDETPTLPVVLHALDQMREQGNEFEAVFLLQPTSPLRTTQTIDSACEHFLSSGADTLISVLGIPQHHHPYWALIPGADGSLKWAMGSDQPPSRRQDLPPAFHREGSIYIVRTETLVRSGTLYGKRVVPWRVQEEASVNIDSPEDMARASHILEARQSTSREI